MRPDREILINRDTPSLKLIPITTTVLWMLKKSGDSYELFGLKEGGFWWHSMGAKLVHFSLAKFRYYFCNYWHLNHSVKKRIPKISRFLLFLKLSTRHPLFSSHSYISSLIPYYSGIVFGPQILLRNSFAGTWTILSASLNHHLIMWVVWKRATASVTAYCVIHDITHFLLPCDFPLKYPHNGRMSLNNSPLPLSLNHNSTECRSCHFFFWVGVTVMGGFLEIPPLVQALKQLTMTGS